VVVVLDERWLADDRSVQIAHLTGSGRERSASIDWMRKDSQAIMGILRGSDNHGISSLKAPVGPAGVRRDGGSRLKGDLSK
jgi:hypothetical protein